MRIFEYSLLKLVRVGVSVIFRCKVIGYLVLEYLWVKDSVEVFDGINEELILDCVRLEDSGNYVCIVFNRLNM